MAFDWLYGYAGFVAALKVAVAADMVAGAERMLALPSLRDPAQASYHNHTVRQLALAFFSLVAVEGHPSVEARAAPLRAHAFRALDNVLEQTDLVNPDGGYHESTDYMRITWAPLAMMSEVRRTATGVDPAVRFPVFRNMGETYLYKVLPDGTNADQKMLQLGVTFDFKFLKLHGAYADQKNIAFVGTAQANNSLGLGSYIPTGRGNYNNQAFMFGLSAPLFGGSIFGSYQWSDADNIVSTVAGNLQQFEPDYNVWGIGYSYPFSRRTNMYAVYGQRSWDGSVRSATGVLLTNASQVIDRDYFTLGIRHSF